MTSSNDELTNHNRLFNTSMIHAELNNKYVLWDENYSPNSIYDCAEYLNMTQEQ